VSPYKRTHDMSNLLEIKEM